MPFTVLSVAYPFAPVGPGCVGGAEQILTELDWALVEAGHGSLVLASEGSAAAGELFALPSLRDTTNGVDTRLWRERYGQPMLDHLIATRPIDLIHAHDTDFHEYRWPVHIPVLVTLHLPLSWYPAGARNFQQPNVQLQCVSETQRRAGPAALARVPVIANGVKLTVQPREKEDFAIALGRICPEKNQHAALEAGFCSKTRVILGGRVFPWPDHQRYFHEKIEPLLEQEQRGIRHEFRGPLLPSEKTQLLARARCLLHPTLAPETSSLVAMEALAGGTPVVAYPSGALPEIVDDGITGFLVRNQEEMALAIHRAGEIDSKRCRAAAAQRFSRERMVAEYFDLYSELTGVPLREQAHV